MAVDCVIVSTFSALKKFFFNPEVHRLCCSEVIKVLSRQNKSQTVRLWLYIQLHNIHWKFHFHLCPSFVENSALLALIDACSYSLAKPCQHNESLHHQPVPSQLVATIWLGTGCYTPGYITLVSHSTLTKESYIEVVLLLALTGSHPVEMAYLNIYAKIYSILFQACTTLSLDLCADFVGSVVGHQASFLFHISQQIFAYLRGYKC